MRDLGDIVEPLCDWYEQAHRALPWREEQTPYRVWISEIMLQQTRVEAVKGYFARFLQAFPTVEALAQAPEQQLLKLWEGLGYYNRARNLQKAAQLVVERYGGQLPDTYEGLLELPGIGSYTAGAVASIAYGRPVPAVDGNVLRVISRITASRGDIADPKTKMKIEQALGLVIPEDKPGIFNQALMELGATICGPNGPPDCAGCPLGKLCEGHALGVAMELPIKTPKKPRKIQHRTVLVLIGDGKVAISKRPDQGLLAGLWEFPNFEGQWDQSQAVTAARALGLEPLRIQPMLAAKHIFTHVEWRMSGWRMLVEETAPVPGIFWANRTQLQKEYPLPSAFAAYLKPLLEEDIQLTFDNF